MYVMGKRVTRTSRLSYYRTPVTHKSLGLIASTLRYRPVKSASLTSPLMSLLDHIGESASPGRVPDGSVFDIAKKRGDAPFVIDVLTVEHKNRFVFYLNAAPTHRADGGGFNIGLAPSWDMGERRLVAGSGVSLVDVERTPVHFTTNMPSRSFAPEYAAPHVLGAASMPAYTKRSLIITGEHGEESYDTDGFVPDGFTQVPWSSDAWSKAVAVPGIDLNDDLNPNVSASLCAHLCVVGDDERVVIVSDFR